MKRYSATAAAFALTLCAERSFAAQVEPMGKAIAALLGTTKSVFQKTLPNQRRFFFSKEAPKGLEGRAVFIENGVYPPNCAHSWAVGIDAQGKVAGVRVLDLGCPHAIPIKAASFLDQFEGRGPADVSNLKGTVHTIAKATGSCDLTTDAVADAIRSYPAAKGLMK